MVLLKSAEINTFICKWLYACMSTLHSTLAKYTARYQVFDLNVPYLCALSADVRTDTICTFACIYILYISEVRHKKMTIVFSLQNMFRIFLYPSSVAIILNC